MRKSLTVVYVTSRKEPFIEWFFDSLARLCGTDTVHVVVVDYYAEQRRDETIAKFNQAFSNASTIRVTECKPTIWQGKYQITREPWWAKSAYLNTGICLCQTEWIAFCDDRCVLGDHWLASIDEAMREPYAVCGAYEKHYNMKVENGVIVDPGVTAGVDTRKRHNAAVPFMDWYGGSGALPLEWCLVVNGFSETLCDSLGLEDAMFGKTLWNSGFPVRYDDRMMIIEDRTPTEIDGALKRADKGVSPNDKSHKIVEILRDKTTSQNQYDIRNLRDRVLLNHEPFPPPVDSHFDWYDGQPIAEME